MEPAANNYRFLVYYTYLTPRGWFALVQIDATEHGPYENEDTAAYHAELWIDRLLESVE